MLGWIAGTVTGGWLLARRWQPIWVIGCTTIFLFIYAPYSGIAMFGLTILSGVAAITFQARTFVLLGAIATCLIALFAYRFINASRSGADEILLLGFAFYVLRAIHFLLDCYSGKIRATQWKELIAWFWFLPTLQVGPIHRFSSFSRDLTRRRWDGELFYAGLQRILFGYAKLVILGNYLVGEKLTAWIATLEQNSWSYHYFDTIRYGSQLYLRFAGYSDIAIGFALLLGFRVMENFHFPFLATDIVDFWRRWHISLSTWCRDYVYVPVLAVIRIPALAAISSMVFLGVWHELSLRYLFWGLWHGLGIALCHRWKQSNAGINLSNSRWKLLWNPIALLLTQHFVLMSFTLTSLGSLEEAAERWRILLGMF